MPHPDDYTFYIECGCTDCSGSLGIQSMPSGYALMLDADRMYFFWMELATGRGRGEHHHASKLTQSDVEEIRRSTLSQRTLAKRFCVAQSTIWAVKTGRIWQGNPQANPPNHPRWASRLTLIVEGVKVERLQDISEEDAKAEGIERDYETGAWWGAAGMGVGGATTRHGSPKLAFRNLWDSINSKRGYGWSENPWVVAVSFRPVAANIDRMEDE